MIITLTLNPALDKSTETEKLIPEKKMRCEEMRIEAGGGGINVSKAIKELGGESLAVFPSGGDTGKLLEKILDESGIRFEALPIEKETRENIVVTERSTNKQFRFVLPGPALLKKDLDHILNYIEKMEGNISHLVFSGSLPPGTPEDLLSNIASITKSRSIKFIVDTSGAPLKKAWETGVYLLKPNLSELCSLVGKEYLELSEIDEAAEQVLQDGHCEVVVVSMGPAGALAVTKDLKKRIITPAVKKLSTVGAGDSMVGGLLWMLQKGEPLEKAVQFGVACGTAATMNKGTQLFKKADAERLYEWIEKNG